jgi:hypothetical protein
MSYEALTPDCWHSEWAANLSAMTRHIQEKSDEVAPIRRADALQFNSSAVLSALIRVCALHSIAAEHRLAMLAQELQLAQPFGRLEIFIEHPFRTDFADEQRIARVDKIF